MKLTRGTMAMALGLVLYASMAFATVVNGTMTKNGLTGNTSYTAGSNNPTLIVDMQMGEYDCYGTLSGDLAVQVKGMGSQQFCQSSTVLTGNVTIGDGSFNDSYCSVLLGAENALGTGKLTVSAALDMNGNSQGVSGLRGTDTASITNSSTTTASTLTIRDNTDDLTLDNAYKGTLSGNINLGIYGSNQVFAGNASSCTGDVTIGQSYTYVSYVKLDASLFKTGQPYAGQDETKAFGSGSITFTQNDFKPQSSTLDLGDRNLTVAGIATSAASGYLYSTGADTTLEFNGSGSFNANLFFGKVESNAKTDHNIHIKQTGTGSQLLYVGSDDDQYNHNKVGMKGDKITVTNGTLSIVNNNNSKIELDGGIEVTGGTLNLTGISVKGSVNVDGGTFSLANGSLDIDSTSALEIALGTTMNASASQLAITSGGKLTISLDEELQEGQTYDVLQLNNGSISGQFATGDVTLKTSDGNKTLAELGASLIYNNSQVLGPTSYGNLSSLDTTINRIQLVVNGPGPGPGPTPGPSVPEPTTWAMLLLGLFGMGLYSRKSIKK